MTPLQIVFILVSLVTILSAIFVVSLRKIFHAALWLIVTLMGVAIIFALLEASFFAAVQILVYIGAIAIILIFAIMLTRNIMSDDEIQINRSWGIVMLLVLIFAVIFISQLSSSAVISTTLVPLEFQGQESIIAFGEGLLDPAGYALPFELASLLLLGALVGGVYIAMDKKGGENK
ncbi:MAG: NADH-quinone oxidoreductase subunit J [Chloroflexi bacterium HGW-Chloroflexi-2]|nr:MAG: NADH-quinone oxidoreductase subunit J [Chloroflexi bacterium HGW-Chloroflexi-2]